MTIALPAAAVAQQATPDADAHTGHPMVAE